MAKKHLKRARQKLSEIEQIRFGAVGAVNTTVDFGVLFFFSLAFTMPPVIANLISTSVALGLSYLLNKRVVFMDAYKHNFRQVILFVAVTLFGLWVIQGIVLIAAPNVLWLFYNMNDTTILFISKIAATAVSLTWNYWWYSNVVFKNKKARTSKA